MRTETIVRNIYKVEELSEKARNKAFSDWCEVDEFNNSDNEQILNAFCSVFPVTVSDWAFSEGQHYIKHHMTTEYGDTDELTGLRLRTFIINNYFHELYKGKYYSSKGYFDSEQQYHYVCRHSKVIFERGCTLTGYGNDLDILSPIFKFLDLKDPRDCMVNLKYLMGVCLDKWLTTCENDYDHYYTMEHFIELSSLNEWEYLEDGNYIN